MHSLDVRVDPPVPLALWLVNGPVSVIRLSLFKGRSSADLSARLAISGFFGSRSGVWLQFGPSSRGAGDAGARFATLRATLTPSLARVLHSAGRRLASRPSFARRHPPRTRTARADSTPTEGPSAGGGGAGTLERGNNDDRPSPQLSAPMPAANAREEIRAAVYDRKAEEGIRVVTKRAPKLCRGDVLVRVRAVSYTHLTLPTNREV